MFKDEPLNNTTKQIGYITVSISKNFNIELGDYIRGDKGDFLTTLTRQEANYLIKCLVSQDTACFKFKFWAIKKGREENTMDDEEKKDDESGNSGDEADESEDKE